MDAVDWSLSLRSSQADRNVTGVRRVCPSMGMTVPGAQAGQERDWISCAQGIRVGSHVEEAEQNR